MAIPHMMGMEDFNDKRSPAQITQLISGKTIRGIEADTGGSDNMLIIHFSDDSRIYLVSSDEAAQVFFVPQTISGWAGLDKNWRIGHE